MKARPFLKWAGGKNQLLSQFEPYYPFRSGSATINQYVEPFIGAGAVFFDLVQRHSFKSVTIGDINLELVLAYRVVQAYPDTLLKILESLQKQYDNAASTDYRAELFSQIRQQFNQESDLVTQSEITQSHIQRVAQLIFLNKTCFNGLFRLNSKGEFNVPFGRYLKPTIADRANILAASAVLRSVNIISGDYTNIESLVDSNTFVYLDPPYRPVTQTSSFTTYSGKSFDDQEQIRLALFLKKLHQNTGCKLMLSNSDPCQYNAEDTFFDHWYQGFYIHRVYANRAINSNGQKRNKISELLITNYPHEQRTLAFNF